MNAQERAEHRTHCPYPDCTLGEPPSWMPLWVILGLLVLILAKPMVALVAAWYVQ